MEGFFSIGLLEGAILASSVNDLLIEILSMAGLFNFILERNVIRVLRGVQIM